MSVSAWPPAELEDGNGGAVLTIEDINERVRSARAAAEADERFRFVFEHAPVGMALVDVSERPARLVQVNETLAALVGRSVPELLGLSLEDLIITGDREPGQKSNRSTQASLQSPHAYRDP